MTGLLRQLGVSDDRIYRRRGVPERAALLHDILARHDALLVLDNAAGEEQVGQLLPTNGSCHVLITSRRQFAAGEQRMVVPLEPLTTSEALELLARFDRAGRVAADPRSARRLADGLCFRIPLDLVALGGRLADPAELGWHLADHVARLESFPPDEVSRPALAASYHRLPPPAQRFFRQLAVHPGSDFAGEDAAALASVPVAEAGRILAQLRDFYLLQQPQPGRYRFHDAVRAYADRLCRDRDPLQEQDAALRRLLSHHRTMVAVAMERLQPATVAWLDRERGNLLAAANVAASRGWLAHTCYLSATLPRYLDLGGHWLEAETLHRQASRTEEPAARATALVNLGHVQFRLASYGPATDRFRQALALFRKLRDTSGQARCHNGLAVVHYRLGEYGRAKGEWEQALTMFRVAGHRQLEASVLNNLGCLAERQQQYQLALSHHERSLEIARERGDLKHELPVRNNLGLDCVRVGRLPDARAHLDRALCLAQELGGRASECETRRLLGFLLATQEHLADARQQYELALAGYRETGNREGEALVYNNLAEILRRQGDHAAALAQHRTAMVLAERLGKRHEVARAHDGIGLSLAAEGQAALAASHWRSAEAIYRALGVPEADEVASRLRSRKAGMPFA